MTRTDVMKLKAMGEEEKAEGERKLALADAILEALDLIRDAESRKATALREQADAEAQRDAARAERAGVEAELLAARALLTHAQDQHQAELAATQVDRDRFEMLRREHAAMLERLTALTA